MNKEIFYCVHYKKYDNQYQRRDDGPADAARTC